MFEHFSERPISPAAQLISDHGADRPGWLEGVNSPLGDFGSLGDGFTVHTAMLFVMHFEQLHKAKSLFSLQFVLHNGSLRPSPWVYSIGTILYEKI